MKPNTSRRRIGFGSAANDWMFVCGFYVMAIARGLETATQSPPGVTLLLIPFASSLIIGLWAIRDAARRGQPVPLLSQQWFILFAAFTVPYYVLKTRRWRGAFLLILHLLGWVLVATATVYVFTLWSGQGV